MSDRQKHVKRRRPLWLRLLLWSGAALALLLLVVCAGLFWLLRTDSGRTFLASQVEQAAAGPEFFLELEGLNGPLPFSLELERLAVGDGGGVWLEAWGVRVDPDLSAALRGEPVLELLEAESVHWVRMPEGGEEGEDAPEEAAEEPVELTMPTLPRFRLDALQIYELSFPGSVPKERFTLSGFADLGPEESSTALALEPTGPDADALLQLQALAAGQELEVTLEYREGPDGPAARLAGLRLEQGAELTLDAGGRLDSWNGTLRADAPDTASLQTDFGVTLPSGDDQTLTFSLQGGGETRRDLLPALAPLGRTVDFGLSGSLEGGAVSVRSLTVATPETSVAVSGEVSPGPGTLDLSWTVTASDTMVLANLAGLEGEAREMALALREPVKVQGTAQGPLAAPDVTARTALGPVQADPVGVQTVQLDLSVQPDDGWEHLDVQTVVDLEGLSGPEPWALSETAELRADAGLDLTDGPSVRVRSAALRAGEVEVSASGEVGPGGVDLEAALKVEEAARYAGLTGVALEGPLTLDMTASGPVAPMDLQVSARGTLPGAPGAGPEAAALLGPSPGLDVSVALQETRAERVLHLKSLSLEAAAGDFELQGKVALDTMEIDTTWELVLDDLQQAGEAAGLELAGTARLQGSASGGWPGLRVRTTAEVDDLVWAGEEVADLDVFAEVGPLPDDLSGRVEIEAARHGETLQLQAKAEMQDETLAVETFALQGASADITGGASIFLDSGQVEGQVRGSVEELRTVRRVVGPLLSGLEDLSGSLSMDVRLTPRGDGQAVSADVSLERLRAMSVDVGSVSLSADVDDLLRTPGGEVSLLAQNVEAGTMLLDSVAADLSGDLQSATGTVELEAADIGRLGAIDVTSRASLERQEDSLQVTLEALDGTFLERSLSLEGPARVTAGPEETEGRIALKLGESRIAAEGKAAPDGVEGTVDLSGVDLELFNRFLPTSMEGELDGKATLAGTLADPEVTADLQVKGLSPAGMPAADAPQADIGLQASIDEGRLQADLTVSGLAEEPGTGSASMPVEFSLSPFAFSLPPEGELDAAADLALDLRLVPALVRLDDHLIQGVLRMKGGMEGTTAEPDFNAALTLEGARYENLMTGTLLIDLDLDANLHTDRLELNSLTATDGGSGRLTAEGYLMRKPTEYSLQVKLDDMQLIQRDEAEALVDGRLTLDGDAQQALLEGDLTIPRAEVFLEPMVGGSGPADRVLAAMDSLKVREAGEVRKQGAQDAQTGFELLLDVDVTIPDKTFVRGLGVDSEWRGEIKAEGSAGAPKIIGKVSPVRGRVDFLGRRFTLDRESLIQLDGATPPDPLLNVRATTTTEEVEAVVIIAGRATQPKLRLESSPPLARDEILAYVLFGRSMSGLTPLQAVQLAQVARAFSGEGGGGLDILGGSRSALGLDMLDVRQSDASDRGVAVGAGTYVTDEIFVGVERDLSTGENSVGVEVEVTPNISVESDVSNQGGQGVGVNWKYDY